MSDRPIIPEVLPPPSGRSKGSAQPSTPDPVYDTIHGRGTATGILMIGQGPLEGFPVAKNDKLAKGNRKRHIYLDNVPLRYATASDDNFQRVTVAYRNGSPLQEGIPGYTDAIAEEEDVNVFVTKKGGAVIRSFTNGLTDVLRINIAVQLFRNVADGDRYDIKRNELKFRISTKREADDWVVRKTVTLNEIVQQTVGLSYDFGLANLGGNAANWQIRLEKLTEDSTDANSPNTLQWVSFGKIVEDKIGYNNLAIVGYQIDSRFGGFPTVTINQHGIKNLLYPTGATIRGDRTLALPTVWNGGLSVSSVALNSLFPTLLNELTNPQICRKFYSLSEINLASLYEIEKWNSTLITHPDGKQRPRFRLRFYFGQKQSGLQTLEDLLGSCFADAYDGGGQLNFTQDRDGLPIVQDISNSMIEGEFDYPETLSSARYNTCRVKWWNPETATYDYARYSDYADIRRNGRKETPLLIALGCENQYQADLYAKAIVITSQLEVKTCQFQAHPAVLTAAPGQIIRVFDERTSNVRIGGRLMNFLAPQTLTIDAPTYAFPGDSISYTLPSGATETRVIGAIATDGINITLTTPPSATPAVGAGWGVSSSVIQPQLFKIKTITTIDDSAMVEVACINYVTNKWGVIEQDQEPYNPPIRVAIDYEPKPPTNLSAALLEVDAAGQDISSALFTVQCSWIPQSPNAVKHYVAEYRVAPDGLWQEPQVISKNTPEVRWAGKVFGRYQVRVQAVNIYNKTSVWAISQEITNVITNIATTTATQMIVIPVSHISLLGMTIRNNGPSSLSNFFIRYITHSSLSFTTAASLSRQYVELTVNDILSTRNAQSANNISLPILGNWSSPETVAPGSSFRLTMQTNGIHAIAIYAQAASGTAQLKIWTDGDPFFGEFF